MLCPLLVACKAVASAAPRQAPLHALYLNPPSPPRPPKVPLDQGALQYVPWVSDPSQQDVMAGPECNRILASMFAFTTVAFRGRFKLTFGERIPLRE